MDQGGVLTRRLGLTSIDMAAAMPGGWPLLNAQVRGPADPRYRRTLSAVGRCPKIIGDLAWLRCRVRRPRMRAPSDLKTTASENRKSLPGGIAK